MSTHGPVLDSVAKFRPIAVLFDSSSDVSVLATSVISTMFQPMQDDEWSQRTVLYCSTQGSANIPNFLRHGNETVILTGEPEIRAEIWSSPTTQSPIFVQAQRDGLVVSGNWTSIGAEGMAE